MRNLDLPSRLEPFRSQLKATVKPYVEIKAHLTREVNLWQSKFFGFPYLPKDFSYPTTPEGDYLHLLAQINFQEFPQLEGFPQKGILQFYISATLYTDVIYIICQINVVSALFIFRILTSVEKILSRTLAFYRPCGTSKDYCPSIFALPILPIEKIILH